LVYIYDAKDLELALQFEPWAKSIKVVSEHLVEVSASQMGKGKIQVIRISPNTHEFIRTSIDKENPMSLFLRSLFHGTIKNPYYDEGIGTVVNGLSSKEKYFLQLCSEDAYRAQDIFGMKKHF
jgi:hypothetical protein